MPFYFVGGDFLNKIGATWFTSYAYYEKINSTHKNWERVKTFPYRISIYNKSKRYHKIWLDEVMYMNSELLETNKIGLNVSEIKRMAKEILEKFDN